MKRDLFDEISVVDVSGIISALRSMPLDQRVSELNRIRAELHEISPFQDEPVDFVEWVPSVAVSANDYNPNSVAPPEMELLRKSIMADGYTQPIVTYPEDGKRTVVDGFHRNRVGKECKDVHKRVHGYLPVVRIRQSQEDKGDRIAATIRHNRARGKHKVEAMSEIVVELKRRNWSDEKIASELGMDSDEVLRLCQITGLAEAFQDRAFSEAWEISGDSSASISDLPSDSEFNDNGRIYHTWEHWECFKAGFFAERTNGITVEDGEEMYRLFLSDLEQFEIALRGVIADWRFSCEHNLSNERMNRVAWLGQAAMAYAKGIPAVCRGGYHRLMPDQQQKADALALEYLNKWLVANGRDPVDASLGKGRTETELY